MSDNKQISSDTLIEFAEIRLKKAFLILINQFLKLRGTAMGTKFAPPYTALVMAYFAKKFSVLLGIWWMFIHNILLFGNMEKNLWKNL